MTQEKGKWQLIKPRTGGARQRRGRDPRQLHLADTQQWEVSVYKRLSEYVLIFERVPTKHYYTLFISASVSITGM